MIEQFLNWKWWLCFPLVIVILIIGLPFAATRLLVNAVIGPASAYVEQKIVNLLEVIMYWVFK